MIVIAPAGDRRWVAGELNVPFQTNHDPVGEWRAVERNPPGTVLRVAHISGTLEKGRLGNDGLD